MFRSSLRWSFLGWLLIVLALGLGGFGGTLYYLERRSRLHAVDLELEGAAEVVAERLTRIRPRRGGPPPPRRDDERFLDGMPPPGRDGRPRPRPGGEPREGPEILDLPESFLKRGAGIPDGAAYLGIWRTDGSLAKSINLPADVERPAPASGADVWTHRDRGPYREVALAMASGPVILVGRSVVELRAELQHLLAILLGSGGAVLGLGLVGAWFIAKRILRPIEAISRTAESISSASLSQRIDIHSTQKELGQLATILNTTFDRLEAAFSRQAQFTADASHELRTPLAVILAQTTLARRRERSPQEYREAIEACHSAAHRMKGLVDGLLTLARNDAGDLGLVRAPVALQRLVDDGLFLLQPLAAERGVALRREGGEAVVEGDAEKLSQVVINLVTNGILYNRPGGEVVAAIRTEGGAAILSVADTGVGIAPEHLEHVFDRFFRVDRARSRREGGTGLGLAIARAIVEGHGGSIDCRSRPGEGSVFTVRLPLPANPPPVPAPEAEASEPAPRESSPASLSSPSLNSP